jgi:hypothetical protein
MKKILLKKAQVRKSSLVKMRYLVDHFYPMNFYNINIIIQFIRSDLTNISFNLIYY